MAGQSAHIQRDIGVKYASGFEDQLYMHCEDAAASNRRYNDSLMETYYEGFEEIESKCCVHKTAGVKEHGTSGVIDKLVSGQLNWALALGRNTAKDKYSRCVNRVLWRRVQVHCGGRLSAEKLKRQRHIATLILGPHSQRVSKSVVLHLLVWDWSKFDGDITILIPESWRALDPVALKRMAVEALTELITGSEIKAWNRAKWVGYDEALDSWFSYEGCSSVMLSCRGGSTSGTNCLVACTFGPVRSTLPVAISSAVACVIKTTMSCCQTGLTIANHVQYKHKVTLQSQIYFLQTSLCHKISLLFA